MDTYAINYRPDVWNNVKSYESSRKSAAHAQILCLIDDHKKRQFCTAVPLPCHYNGRPTESDCHFNSLFTHNASTTRGWILINAALIYSPIWDALKLRPCIGNSVHLICNKIRNLALWILLKLHFSIHFYYYYAVQIGFYCIFACHSLPELVSHFAILPQTVEFVSKWIGIKLTYYSYFIKLFCFYY